jgi:transposase-like protein
MNKTSSQSEHPIGHRRSRAEVAELVAAFERSGLNRSEYCRRHGLSLSSLKRYSKRMEDAVSGLSDRSERTAPAVSLIPVEVLDCPTAQQASQTALFVELCFGRRIGVDAGFDGATLRRLIAVLDGV